MNPIDPKIRITVALHAKIEKLAKKEGITLKEAGIKIVKAGLATL